MVVETVRVSRILRLGGGNTNARVIRIMRVTRVIRRKKCRADPQEKGLSE